jgi:D-3-phosphoglycerate dehydrogenase
MPAQPTWIFDFDSTLVRVEALDELADIALQGRADHAALLARIKLITNQGMEGAMTIEDSLRQRLDLLALDARMLPALVERLCANFTDSVWRGRRRLSDMRDQVWVVSGGCREWIAPVVERLGLRGDHVVANWLRPRADGLLELDPASPCAVDSGKATAIDAAALPRPRLMVGDGMTDWRVREHGACERFICFTEVVRREAVVTRADVVADCLDAVLAVRP